MLRRALHGSIRGRLLPELRVTAARPGLRRWLSDAAASTPAASTEPESAAASATSNKQASSFRNTMMRAIKDRQFEQVLNEYDDMVLAGVKPDTLIMNCLVEAKAQNEGTQQARETLQVSI